VACQSSADEIDDDKMQNDMGKDEVCKRSLGSDARKLHFVLWVDLYSQAHCHKHTMAHDIPFNTQKSTYIIRYNKKSYINLNVTKSPLLSESSNIIP